MTHSFKIIDDGFDIVDKITMMIRGALNKNTAEGLKYTADKNKVLLECYNNYPNTPEEFPIWHNTLMKELNEAFERFEITPKIYT